MSGCDDKGTMRIHLPRNGQCNSIRQMGESSKAATTGLPKLTPEYNMHQQTSGRISHPASASAEVQEQIAEIWTMLRRHPALALTCVAVALAIGTLYYLRAPRTYESKAELLLETKQYSLDNTDESDNRTHDATLETQVRMICTPMIVGPACKNYELAALPSLASEEDPVTFILDNLTAQISADNAAIIEISYRSTVAEDAKEVVDAIAHAYTEYLQNKIRSEGERFADLMQEANDNLLAKLQSNQEKHQEFQKNAPLIWREGQGVNIHLERQVNIEAKRHELMTEQTILAAKIAALKNALASGSVSRDALHFQALQAMQLNQDDFTWRAFQIAERERYAEREAARSMSSALAHELVKLDQTESQLVHEFDDGHPEVSAIRQRKEHLRERLQESFEAQVKPTDLLDETSQKLEDKKDYVAIYLQSLNDQKAVLDRQISALDRAFQDEQQLANAMQEFMLKDQALKSEFDNTKQIFDVVVTKLQQMDVTSSYGGQTATIVTPARIGEQVAPRLLLVLFGSMILGMTSACGWAWARERSEDTFHSTEEIRHALGVPVLGRIPVIHPAQLTTLPGFEQIDSSIFTLHDESSSIAEAFRGIRTNLFFSTAGESHQVIQVTSPLPSDGKSTVAANLGVAIAKSGKRVLMVDADFRRPALTEMYGLAGQSRHGFAELLDGEGTIDSSIIETEIDNLSFLSVHRRPSQPSELLSQPEFEVLISEFKKRFDVVLIDTPPILPVTDPCVIAPRVDCVLVTLRLRRGVQEAARRGVEMLADVNANVIGVVANAWTPQSQVERSCYGFGYGPYANGTFESNANGSRTNGKHTIEVTTTN